MSDAEAIEEEVPKKRSKLPLILGLVLALALGGGGFFAVYSGMLFGSGTSGTDHAHEKIEVETLPEVAFVPIDPLVINLGKGSASRHLKFRAQLEVDPPFQSEVSALLPRVLDVLNGYLRAVSTADLEEPTALIRLRAQMLRRVQMVTGEGRVRDLLIMEFVLN
ncbi:MAG: flagellar basal body-associated FliL family protein [Rhodobacter sp.]|nr:flagellar basal body-associated FliL family protein [Rhodobacter sp.]